MGDASFIVAPNRNRGRGLAEQSPRLVRAGTVAGRPFGLRLRRLARNPLCSRDEIDEQRDGHSRIGAGAGRQRGGRPGGGQSGLMWIFLSMLLPMLVASLLGVNARSTYLRDVATAAASSRADKS